MSGKDKAFVILVVSLFLFLLWAMVHQSAACRRAGGDPVFINNQVVCLSPGALHPF